MLRELRRRGPAESDGSAGTVAVLGVFGSASEVLGSVLGPSLEQSSSPYRGASLIGVVPIPLPP